MLSKKECRAIRNYAQRNHSGPRPRLPSTLEPLLFLGSSESPRSLGLRVRLEDEIPVIPRRTGRHHDTQRLRLLLLPGVPLCGAKRSDAVDAAAYFWHGQAFLPSPAVSILLPDEGPEAPGSSISRCLMSRAIE